MVLLVFQAFLEEVLDLVFSGFRAFLDEEGLDYFCISHIQGGGKLRTTVARQRLRLRIGTTLMVPICLW